MALTDKVDIPNNINPGVSPAHQDTMLQVFGVPGAKTDDCSDPTNPDLQALIVTQNVGPFKVTGIQPAVDALARVFASVKASRPDLFNALGTEGMLCCRKIGGGTNFSNHSWGTAIDLTIGGELAQRGDPQCQVGMLELAPFFNAEKFFWGAAFPTPDTMHFEISDELIRKWRADGIV